MCRYNSCLHDVQMKGTLCDNRTKDFRRTNSHFKKPGEGNTIRNFSGKASRSGMPNSKVSFVSLTASMERKVTS
jgi:hypothetical protein